jgi:Glu-tRNA(Gln) amidotransferase subunit E-like FAD-binding protein
MSEIDYEKIKLKAGLEIHQQLDTGKLFCNCPGFLRTDKADFVVKRKLHAVAGESGEVDSAVEYEASLKKDFYYEGYKDSTCLVELDECPPYPINESALDEALKIALLLNCEIYAVTQVMRKTVIDGSNTSGFQRTVLIAHDGYLETSFGKVGIASIGLEEDAARIVEKTKDKAVYRLDRLGIPLVEIGTEPDMKTPEQIKETALKLGEIIRACKVKRGIGTIRQDVNISIKGHDRVEIKGFQEPKIMLLTVNKEIERQQSEIAEGKTKGEVRASKEDGSTEYLRPMPGEARMYPDTDLPLLKIGRERINKLKKELPKLKHEIKAELKKKGLSEELINAVLENNKVDEFEVLMKIYNKDADLVGKAVTLWIKEFANKFSKSEEQIADLLNEALLEKVLIKVNSGELDKADVRRVLMDIVSGKKFEEAIKIEKQSDDVLEEEIRKIVKEKPGLRAGGYMGLIIAKLGSGLDKKKAMEILNKIVEGK